MNGPTYRTTFGFVLGVLALIVIAWIALPDRKRITSEEMAPSFSVSPVPV